jgi:signal transduction histidine kinase
MSRSNVHPLKSPVHQSQTPSALALIDLKDNILNAWMKRVREEISIVLKVDQSVIVDTIPVFLENLAEALSQEHPRNLATESSNVASEHGNERARIPKYSPDQIIKEYVILKDIVEQSVNEVVELNKHELSIVQKSFDQAIQEAMMAYFLSHSKMREQIVATLTHDLRNPLGAASMAAELLTEDIQKVEDPELRAGLQDLAEKICRNVKRTDNLVQDLLDASVLEAGEKIHLRISKCEILSLIQETLSEIASRDVKRIRVEGSACPANLDKEALKRAIANLIMNALKYGDAKTPVKIRLASEFGRAYISVHNKGNPIPLEDQANLFQAYKRSPQALESGQKGWGLGLAAVRMIAESLNGALVLESSPETGTTFTMDIPCDFKVRT